MIIPCRTASSAAARSALLWASSVTLLCRKGLLSARQTLQLGTIYGRSTR
jgi:hypothetical protein